MKIDELDLSNRDLDTLTAYGSIVKAIDDIDDADIVEILVPEDKQECEVSVA